MKLRLSTKVRQSMLAVGVLGAAACGGYSDAPRETTTKAELELRCKDHFALSSPSFSDGAPLPSANTCEGQIFGAGASPELDWKGAPGGTKSYAIVLEDTSIIDGPVPDHAFHWTIWDIPHSVHALPAGLESAQFPAGLRGAQQLNGLPWAPYAYFGPCPSWENLCSGGTVPRTNDSYAFVLYAFDQKKLTLPAADPNIGNYVRQLDAYFASIAIAKTELHFTSDARPISFPQVCP